MKEEIYSKDIADAVSNFLTEDDWDFSFDEQRGLFKLELHFNEQLRKISYIIDIGEDDYIVYAVFPLGVDEDDKEMMASMVEFICRANYGMRNGSFELDMKSGQLRFKSFVDCENLTPSLETVKNSILCPALMYNLYNAGIIDIILGNASAKEAVDRCEKSLEKELRNFFSDNGAPKSADDENETS